MCASTPNLHVHDAQIQVSGVTEQETKAVVDQQEISTNFIWECRLKRGNRRQSLWSPRAHGNGRPDVQGAEVGFKDDPEATQHDPHPSTKPFLWPYALLSLNTFSSGGSAIGGGGFLVTSQSQELHTLALRRLPAATWLLTSITKAGEPHPSTKDSPQLVGHRAWDPISKPEFALCSFVNLGISHGNPGFRVLWNIPIGWGAAGAPPSGPALTLQVISAPGSPVSYLPCASGEHRSMRSLPLGPGGQ